MSKLSHFNRHGEARMVDIAAKAVIHRIAIAEGTIAMNRETLTMVQEGLHKKRDVLGIARIARVMARNKKVRVPFTPLPPFCGLLDQRECLPGRSETLTVAT